MNRMEKALLAETIASALADLGVVCRYPVPLDEQIQSDSICLDGYDELTGSSLSNICRLFEGWNIQYLSLSELRMSAVPRSIGRMRDLEGLNLSDNRLKDLPGHLSNLLKLTRLDVSDNHLRNPAFDFSKLKNLRSLQLDGNRLLTVPPSICQMTELRVLDLAYNKIAHLPEELLDMPSLTHLDVFHNPIHGSTVLCRLELKGVHVLGRDRKKKYK